MHVYHFLFFAFFYLLIAGLAASYYARKENSFYTMYVSGVLTGLGFGMLVVGGFLMVS